MLVEEVTAIFTAPDTTIEAEEYVAFMTMITYKKEDQKKEWAEAKKYKSNVPKVKKKKMHLLTWLQKQGLQILTSKISMQAIYIIR